MKKTLICGAVAAAALFAGNTVAGDLTDDLSLDGSLAVTSDYRFRGISQSNDDVAMQGSINLNHVSGLHAGVWGSSIDFNSVGNDEATLELDYTVGYSFAVSDVAVDVGYIYYTYPNDGSNDNNDYGEIYATAGWKGVEAGVNWTDDGYGKSGKATYVFGGYSHKVGFVTLGAEVGETFLDTATFANGDDKYFNFEVSATVTVLEKMDVQVAYVGTDLSKNDIGGLDWAENAVVATATLNL
jgi:uncharacterized protein (TIGR02001 family)|tara:strand:+ start:269 stop:991 length:723 start_codon:yes stop_codon:yes gene_type:complete